MIIEVITVTTTPTSLINLLAAAGRDLAAEGKTAKARSVAFRLPVASTDVVRCEEVGTQSPVVLLDPANGQPYESHLEVNLHQTLLSVSALTSSVGLIVSQ